MRTVEDIKAAIKTRLDATMPTRCAAIATVDKPCPPPKKIVTHPAVEPPGASEWPALHITENDLQVATIVDHSVDEADPTFEVRYGLSVEGWVRAARHRDYSEAMGLRARLELALREVVLDDNTFRVEELAADGMSLSVEYRPIFETSQGEVATAFLMSFAVVSAEVLTRPVLAEPPLTIPVETIPLEDE